jgi:hypothetical protein
MDRLLQGLTRRECGWVGLGIWTKMKSGGGLGVAYVDS